MFSAEPRAHWAIVLLRTVLAAFLPVAFIALTPRSYIPNSVMTLCLVGIVLVFSGWWGWLPALVATLSGGMGLAFYWFDPVGDFRIENYEDWMTFVAFNALCVSASHFWSRSRGERRRAEERGREVENLQELSRTMLAMTDLGTGIAEALDQIQAHFHFQALALYQLDRDVVVQLPKSGTGGIDAADLRAAALQRCVISHAERQICVVPLVSSGAPIGSFGVRGPRAEQTLCNSIANVLALGIGRLVALENSTRAEAARRLEEMKATVLDALAHNLKTPLTSVRAAVSTLRELPGMDPEQARELLAVADEDTKRLQAMIAEAVETARIDARRQHLQKTSIPVAVAVDRALESVGSNLRRHEVHFDFQEPLPDLYADPDLLNHVLIQLLDNASKYSTECAIIVIGAREVAGGMEVWVSNPGPGIPADEAKNVFERFFRGRATAAKVPGAGIGLAIAKAIMDAHGGSISVVSVPNMTTTFRIQLPMQSAAPQDAARDEQAVGR